MLKLFLCFRKMNSKNNLANSRIILLKSRKKKTAPETAIDYLLK